MNILVTGSSGLIGCALVPKLSAVGHRVLRLVRSSPDAADAVRLDPQTGALVGVSELDAVVNLAGAPLVGRWSQARKKLVFDSRVDSTSRLVAALGKLKRPPKVLLSASGIGAYGNRGDEWLNEESTLEGDDFLVTLAKAWEGAALGAEALGTRVVLMRIGMVLSKNGGALAGMLPPFRLGLGGRLGSGQQWVSWVALADLVTTITFALENETLRGPVNLISPHPVQNAEFTLQLGRALHRPAVLPAPAFVLRLALGEMADTLLLASQRAKPAKLEHAGFRFQHPTLPEAFAAVLAEH